MKQLNVIGLKLFAKNIISYHVLGGAQIVNKTAFVHWVNGEDATAYQPIQPGEYKEGPLS